MGKTTVCQAVAGLARRRGYQPGGVLTPALYDSQGTKVGLEAMDVGSGERWLLARTDLELGGPRVGPYSFDSDGLARALRVLRRAATAGCDLFMIDEIGPLELEQGEGFAPILDLLPIREPTHTLIVVRPELLDRLRRRWKSVRPATFNVTEEERDELPRQIVERLWGRGGDD